MTEAVEKIPDTQYAVELTGPGRLRLNRAKKVHRPGPHQLLIRIEAVGLCFSDIKLLRQFSQHSRKGPVVEGIDPQVLGEIPSYRPGEMSTVCGHETVGVVVATGERVARHRAGLRVVVETDYRWLKTAASAAPALGYNFEGALQQYVIMDERIIVDPRTGESMLIEVDRRHSSSALALVEPWACVEDSYAGADRRRPMDGGKMLVIADRGVDVGGLGAVLGEGSAPASITAVADEAQLRTLEGFGVPVSAAAGIEGAGGFEFDDVVCFGASPEVIETINDKVAPGGIIAVVTGGRRVGRKVNINVGRMHYEKSRWTGTAGDNPAAAYGSIPTSGEIRPAEKIIVVGAGGPMGQMHMIRNICSGVEGISITGTETDDSRLNALAAKVGPIARRHGVEMRLINPRREEPPDGYTYWAIMAPSAPLVARAVEKSAPGGLVNIFAGIAPEVKCPVDLDAYIEKGCFMLGSSGSVLDDMKIVLDKLDRGVLDTNISVDAVSGMAGAIAGICAVENRTLCGKIVVYPALGELALTPLGEMKNSFPTVAERLDDGTWTAQAQAELFRLCR